MSGLGIEISSSIIRVAYNMNNNIMALQLKAVANNHTNEIFPILRIGDKVEIDSEATKRLMLQPETVITNFVHALEIMDKEDCTELSQQLEWGSPVSFETGSVIYTINPDGKTISAVTVFQCIFNIIQSHFAHIEDHQNKAVISVPCSFGKEAISIIEKAAKLFGTCSVIHHDLSAIYSNNLSKDRTLVICCGEYISSVSLFSGTELLWRVNFSDFDLSHAIFVYLQSSPSFRENQDSPSNSAYLYTQARYLARDLMALTPIQSADGLFFLILSPPESLLSALQQFAATKQQHFLDALSQQTRSRDLSTIQNVSICGESSLFLRSAIQTWCAKRLVPSTPVIYNDPQQLVRGSLSFCTQLQDLLISTLLPKSVSVSKEIWVLLKTGLHCIFPANHAFPARKVLQIAFTEQHKYVYFYQGKEPKPLVMYLILFDNAHLVQKNPPNVVLVECVLDEADKLSVFFYWKDNRERVYTIDFGTGQKLATDIVPDDHNVYTLRWNVCNKQSITKTAVTVPESAKPVM